ncbi:MAG: B12-binding domain-containing radical SAM protein [Eubacterium sp.]|nr:B12-binding domain-containing radical SAM protein [Eubacterium sp.]
MRYLLCAVNAKYIHMNPAVHSLKAYADRYYSGQEEPEILIHEATINQHADEILMQIYRMKADVIAFSCYIWNFSLVLDLVRDLRKVLPDTGIWLGGPEVSYDGARLLKAHPEVDLVMQGEGEDTFLELVEASGKRSFAGSLPEAGICFRGDEGEIIDRGMAPPADLDRIPFLYEHPEKFKNKILYYETSRGCPFACSYCLSSVGDRLRFRSLSLVRRELAVFLKAGVPQVKFVDRTFNCNKNHAMEIWRFLSEQDNGVTNFHFEIAADLLDDEMTDFLKSLRPGLVQLEIGVQSTNPETVKAIRRQMNLDRVFARVDQIREAGNIHQHLDLIAGLPYESYDRFAVSFNDLYRHRPDQLQLGFLKVLKGTLMAETAAGYGILYKNRAPYEVLKTDWLSYDDIIALKEVEEMTELYYNSGQFTATLAYAVPFFPSPFLFFEELASFYAGAVGEQTRRNRLDRYRLLRDFLLSDRESAERRPEKEITDQCLIYDLYLRENLKTRPEWAADLSPFRNQIRDLRKGLGESGAGRSRYHIEVFDYDFDDFLKTGRLCTGRYYCLFDYDRRSPLTRAARTKFFKRNDLQG